MHAANQMLSLQPHPPGHLPERGEREREREREMAWSAFSSQGRKGARALLQRVPAAVMRWRPLRALGWVGCAMVMILIHNIELYHVFRINYQILDDAAMT